MSDEKPILSICIPTYNRGKILSENLRKYLANSNEDFEIVVVDNASNDNSYLYLERIKDERFNLYQNDSNIGSFSNGLKALSLAKGKYIMQLMDKDYIKTQNLSKIINFLKKIDVSAGFFIPNLLNDDLNPNFIKSTNKKIVKCCFCGNHPSGIFFNKNDIDFQTAKKELEIYDDEIKAYTSDFILTSLATNKKPFVKINIDFVHFGSPPIEGTKHSYTYSPEKKNLFFVPEFRFKVFENYIEFLERKEINEIQKYFIIRKLAKKMIKISTNEYLWVLNQKPICDWYNLSDDFISSEKQKDLSKEFYERLKNSSVLKKKLIYKFIVLELLKKRKVK